MEFTVASALDNPFVLLIGVPAGHSKDGRLKLITRYILREHIGPLLFAVTTLTSLLLINYVAKKLGEFVGKGIPWSVIGEFFVLSVPFTLAMTMPMAVLIATLYAFSRMASDSEVTALMASGVGTGRLMRPVIVLGLVLSIAMIGFNDQILPRANEELSALLTSISQKKPTLALKEQTLNEVGSSGLYMWLSHLDQSRNAMRGVTIYDLSGPDSRRTIIADSGFLSFAANRRDLILTLHDGYVQETQATTPDRFQRTYFRSNTLRVLDVANQLVLDQEGGYKGDREMTVCEMQREVHRAQIERDSSLRLLAASDPKLANAHKRRYGSPVGDWYCSAIPKALLPKTATAQSANSGTANSGTANSGTANSGTADGETAQSGTAKSGTADSGSAQAGAPPPVPVVPIPPGIPDSLKPFRQIKEGTFGGNVLSPSKALDMSVQQYERRINQYEVEIQKKFALSLACLVFALLGPPIALRFPRSGIGLTIGVSIVVFAIYYVGLIGGESLANDLKASPVVSMWAADAIFGATGIFLTLRMGRRGITSRGGGDSIWSRLFRRNPRPARAKA